MDPTSVRAGGKALFFCRMNAELRRGTGGGERSADWKSAIQQVGNLRYDTEALFALRLVPQRMVHQHQGGHRFDHRDRSRQHAWIVTPAGFQRRVFEIS
jgi:hypothetical protein